MIVKHSTLVTLEAKRAESGIMRTAHRVEFDYDPRPGFLYVRSRAISSRCNDNYDEFPAPELRKAYRSFIGKPVYVNHDNDDPSRARGVIIDAALHDDRNPDGSEDTWVEVLMEIDAVRFPKLAQRIVDGDIERTSMGVNVGWSECSYCGNRAATVTEYCDHVRSMKGARVTAADGTETFVRELCGSLQFFENSVLVEPPADPTAHFLGVDTRGLELAAARKPEFARTASRFSRQGRRTSLRKVAARAELRVLASAYVKQLPQDTPPAVVHFWNRVAYSSRPLDEGDRQIIEQELGVRL